MTSLEDNSDYKKKELKKTLAGLEKERYNFFIFFLPPLVLAAARNMNRRVNIVSPIDALACFDNILATLKRAWVFL